MNNFNVFLIACLAFMFLTLSGCSKDEDSPYTREQIIGKWNQNSFWIVDDNGNGNWIDAPTHMPAYYQFNADGTFYTPFVQDNINSFWKLNGTTIYCRTRKYNSNKLIDYRFNIIYLDNNEIIIKNNDDTNIKKIKFIKE